MAENEQLLGILNKQVANWTVLYTKLHNYHWYVKGPQFLSLHAKFEELYDLANLYIDELAERLLALNGKPVATLKESLATASIYEANGHETTEEMVEQVTNDFAVIAKELEEAIQLANEVHDDATADMFIGIQETLDKNIWMLEAYLEKR
ncbi:Dps family protein [Heyndrickxia acidiproducens]|jgi:starvation-inducible DNA-binding protein|uniref:Dps family protein n=1 Tax=Heyndrickxia acidiproducens TaxID=1121084 RepID=UPI0003823612|nr:Dps family protein [Heyndrickxia acidiproducens]